MEQFVKFSDSKGTPIFLTKKEVERVNKRLEFSHTIKVFGDHASRPLYLMPKEFERGKRRYKTYGDDEERLLDVHRILKKESFVREVKRRGEFILMGLLAAGAVGLWFLGGGKAPAIAYATIDLSGENISKFIVPVAVAFIVGTVLMFAFLRQLKQRKDSGFEIKE